MENKTLCYVAMMDEHYPHILPVNYGYRGKSLFINTGSEDKNYEILKKRPNVSFQMNNLIGRGKAVYLDRFEAREEALYLIKEQSTGDLETGIHPWEVMNSSLFRIDIEELTGE